MTNIFVAASPFEWIDGSTVVFEYWADGEPNGDSEANQACVDMSSEGFWFDQACSDARHFVCKTPKGEFFHQIGHYHGH